MILFVWALFITRMLITGNISILSIVVALAMIAELTYQVETQLKEKGEE